MNDTPQAGTVQPPNLPRGQGMIEYALVIVVVFVAVAAIWGTVSPSLGNTVEELNCTLIYRNAVWVTSAPFEVNGKSYTWNNRPGTFTDPFCVVPASEASAKFSQRDYYDAQGNHYYAINLIDTGDPGQEGV